jgi:hypothetical protein
MGRVKFQRGRLIFDTISHIRRQGRSGQSQVSKGTLDLRHGISHQAAKPEWAESSQEGRLIFDTDIPHQAVKPERDALKNLMQVT